MMGTALASLLAFSIADWPPRLKIPTLYPVFPRFRVGMESEVAALAGRGCEGCAGWPLTTSGRAAEPSAAAVMIPPAFRKVRRLLLEEMVDLDLLMTPPGTAESYYNSADIRPNPRLILILPQWQQAHQLRFAYPMPASTPRIKAK